MSAQHTPGPWVVSPTFSVPVVGYALPDGGEPLPIVNTVQGYNKKQARANARLIAAAPDLLEACKRLIGRMNAAGWEGDANTEFARAAISKATGK